MYPVNSPDHFLHSISILFILGSSKCSPLSETASDHLSFQWMHLTSPLLFPAGSSLSQSWFPRHPLPLTSKALPRQRQQKAWPICPNSNRLSSPIFHLSLLESSATRPPTTLRHSHPLVSTCKHGVTSY